MFRERGKGEGERNIDLFLHLCMNLLVDSSMGPDQGSNLQPWPIGTTLKSTAQPGHISFLWFLFLFYFFKANASQMAEKEAVLAWRTAFSCGLESNPYPQVLSLQRGHESTNRN